MTFDHGYALLIGVGKCLAPQLSLPVTVQDMQALRRILIDPNLCAYPNDEAHVRLLHDEGASRKAILEGLAWLKDRVAADKAATAVVFFSGHGLLDQASLMYYLVPHDYQPGKTAQTAVAAKEFTEAIGMIQARRLLVFIDACHAEALATTKGQGEEDLASVAPPQPVISDLQQGEGRVVFTSSRGSQLSWVRKDGKLSVYTYHLIEALQGAGNKAGDTLIHVAHLMLHLGKTVPATAKSMYDAEQTPYLDAKTEDFPVAMLRGGKGLPAGGWDKVKVEAKKQRGSVGKNPKTGNETKVTAGPRSIVSVRDINATNINTGDSSGPRRQSSNLQPKRPRRSRKS